MSPKEHYLAGLGQEKNHFPNPFRGRSKQEMEDTNFAGELGKLCEAKVLEIWTGDINIDPELKNIWVKTAYDLIIKGVKARYGKTLDADGMRSITEEVAGYRNILDENWRFSIQFKNPDFDNLLKSLDLALGTGLINLFERTASNYDIVNSKTEYLLNTALVLARETVTPTYQPRGNPDKTALSLPGKLIPNVEYKLDGTIAGQYDAILVPTKYPEAEIDLLDYLENKQPWAVVEIKVPFRPRYISGERKIKKPFSWDMDQFRHRLGRLMVWWNEKHKHEESNPFPLPSAVYFCYLRGILPPVTHLQAINYHFLKTWSDQVDYCISGCGPNGEMVEEKELIQIQEQLVKVPYELSYPLFAATELARKKEAENMKENFPTKPISGTQLMF